MSDTTLVRPLAVPLAQDARVIALVGLAHGSSHFSHMLLSPLFPLFIRDFGLTYLELGMLTTVFFVVSGLGQAVSGFVVDRVGARPMLFASLSLFVCAALAASVAQGYPHLFVVSVLAGLGNASFHPIDFTILNQRVSGPRLGYAYSVHGLTGNLGWAAATAFFVGIASLADWRVAYLCAAGVLAAVLLLMWLNRAVLLTEVTPRAVGEAAKLAQRAQDTAFLKLPVVWWCFAFFLLSTMTLAIIQTYGASILQALYGATLTQAATVVTAYMVCGALGMLVGGFVVARAPLASDRVVALCMALGAALLGVCASGWLGSTATMVLLAATGFALGIGGPSRDMMIKGATPQGATGRVYGTVYSGLDVGFALAPLIFGLLMDRGWYAATLGGGAVVLLASAGVARAVGRQTRPAA